MKIIKIKKTGMFFPLAFPQEIKNNKLNYFIQGEGYKKTTQFEILSDEFPEKWDALSWLDIAKLSDTYGLEVGAYYADCKVAGIIARQTANGYMITYKKIKDIIPENFDTVFFECLRNDYMCACYGLYLFDIIATDNALSAINPDYDAINCTYKNKKCSMSEYVELYYGIDYKKIIDRLLS